MNGYELVDKWMTEGRTFISENELKDYKINGKVALLILKEMYEAKYIPSLDPHFCGNWSFENPLKTKTLHYHLYNCFIENDLNFHDSGLFDPTNLHFNWLESITEEIMRLESDKAIKDKIVFALKNNKVYIGKKRIYKIQEEMCY